MTKRKEGHMAEVNHLPEFVFFLSGVHGCDTQPSLLCN